MISHAGCVCHDEDGGTCHAHREFRAAKRAAHRAAGVCYRCGKPKRPYRAECYPCLEKRRAYLRAQRRKT